MSQSRRNLKMTRREAGRLALLGATGCMFGDSAPLVGQPTDKAIRAKSVIQIWMWGGPSHLDTFDPKPGAGQDYTGPLTKAIATNVARIQVGELLPLLAQQADKYSIIRSMTHGVNAHETASYIVQTGRRPDRVVYPCIGAVAALFKGYERGYRGIVPPYIVLTEPQGRFSEEGFLGQRYKPFATGGDPNQKRFIVEGIMAEGISDDRQRGRRDLLHALDSLGKVMPADPEFRRLDECEKKAYNLMFGEARNLFDLSSEKGDLRERYGRNSFGQSCLMARRLVEHGVPYITINYKGWDTHKNHFQIMRRQLPQMDQAMATLLQDLAERGLLDTTLVWWSGEFGRTPRVLWEAPWNGGRGHWGNCFSALVAGGGFQGGHVVGASDARGEEVKDRPVWPQDLLGSILELMGIDPEGPLPNPSGITTQVMPGAGRLKEIM